MDTLRAIDVVDGRCVPVTLPRDACPPGSVRLRVLAAGVNRADLVQKAGRYPPPPGASRILGLEVAGEVVEVGADTARWRIGDRVCALLTGGGYADEVVVDGRCALPWPEGLDAAHAACVIEVWATAWLNLGRLGGLADRAPGARVLLHAGASGVGTAGIQIARLLGHRAFVTVGSADKVARCVALGADGGAVRHDGPWVDAVRAWAPAGVDVVLDPVGGAYLAHDLDVLAPEGRAIVIGLMGGRPAQIDLGQVLMKRLRVEGSTLRARSVAFKAELLASMEAALWPAFADGRLRPILDRAFPLADAEAAHAHVASNTTFGAVVLVP